MMLPSHTLHYTDTKRVLNRKSLSMTVEEGMPRTRYQCPSRWILWALRLCIQNQQRVKQVIILSALAGVVIGIVYLFMFTPTAVYMLDRLNLRPFFLPNIVCKNCTHLPFKYIINNQSACSGQETFMLNVVISHHANVRARNNIRKTWGAVREYRGYRVKTMFAFGTSDDHNLNNQPHVENELYHDIIQGDFKDSYNTLTQKSIMILHWFTNHCPNAKFLHKTDDDSFNHPKRYIDYLKDVKQEKFVGGLCFTVMPDRRKGSKYYVAPEMYPDTYYPTYCTGPGYTMSQKAAVDILAVSPNVIYLPMEDVYIAGMCRVAANLTYTQIPGVVVGGNQLTRCDLATWAKNTHNIVPERMLTLWEDVKSAQRGDCLHRDCLKVFILVAFFVVWMRHLMSLR